MKFSGKALYRALTMMLLILLILTKLPVVAFRLKGEKKPRSSDSLVSVVNPLERAPVPPVGPSPCTHITGGTPGGHCPKE